MRKIPFIIGPCVLESRDLAMNIAETLRYDLAPFIEKGEIELYFKGSFDKANRSSLSSFRGPGIDEGLKILAEVKKTFALPVLTDFHYPEQAMAVAEVVDILQVPAFLVRQTDMVVAGAQAAARFQRILNVKKAQFMAPGDVANVVEKMENFLPKKQMLLTERGTSFGYNNLIVDMASFQHMASTGVNTIFDVTHSVQKPGGEGKITGGKRAEAYVLARAAVAAGAHGIFMETHPVPDQALSDKTTCLPLLQIKTIVGALLDLYHVCEQLPEVRL